MPREDLEQLVRGHEKEGWEGKDGGNASAQGGANDQECGRQCWISALDHEANTMEERCTDLGEKKKRMRCCWAVVRQKRKDWSTHWQCDEDVQKMQDRPWRNEELKRSEEALLRLKDDDSEKTSRMCTAKTG